MELDPAVIIPAILFTVFAIYLASSFLNKKVEAPANKKKRRVDEEEEDEVCSSSFVSVQNVEPRVEKPPVIEEVKPAVVAKAEPVPVVAPVVEEVRPVETVVSGHQSTEVEVAQAPEPEPEPVEEPKPAWTEPEIISLQEPVVKSIAAPEPVVPAVGAVTELLVESVPVPELQSLPEPQEEEEPAIVVEPVVVAEPVVVGEPEPITEAQPEPEPESVSESTIPTEPFQPTADETPIPEPTVEFEVLPEETSPDDVPRTNMAAEEEERVTFTPGKKQSRFETMMTKEEMEEEQRATE